MVYCAAAFIAIAVFSVGAIQAIHGLVDCLGTRSLLTLCRAASFCLDGQNTPGRMRQQASHSAPATSS
jgi:hypothetical protein